MLLIKWNIQTSLKTFVETVHKELEAKEKYVQNHEAWHHLFDVPTNRKDSISIFLWFITNDYEQGDWIFHRPPFDPTSTNNIRGAGKVMHDGIEYYIYLWAECLFICNKDDFGQNR